MSRRFHAVLIVASLVPTVACKSKLRVCEHARDRAIEMTEADTKLAVQDAGDLEAETRARGKTIVDALREGFVESCVELEDAQYECMVNIDAYADAYVAAQTGMVECGEQPYADDDARRAACEKWSEARSQANKDYGSTCDKLLTRMFDTLLK